MSGGLEVICVRLLRRCNLQCHYCWANSNPNETDELSAEAVLRLLAQLRDRGLCHVSLSGGEPALYRELPRVVDGALALGLHVTITTNGTVSRSVLSQLRENGLNDWSKLRLRVSLDGGSAFHDSIRGPGTFLRAVSEVGRIREHTGWVGINAVVTPDFIQGLPELVMALRKIGADELALMSLVPWLRSPNAVQAAGPIVGALRSAAQECRALGFSGNIVEWDYLSHPLGSVVVDANGVMFLSATRKENEVLIGVVDTVAVAEIEAAIEQRLKQDPVGYFAWSAWG